MRTLKITITDEETKTTVAAQVTFDQINDLALNFGVDIIHMITNSANNEMNLKLGQDQKIITPPNV